jgi:hypothetical protein
VSMVFTVGRPTLSWPCPIRSRGNSFGIRKRSATTQRSIGPIDRLIPLVAGGSAVSWLRPSRRPLPDATGFGY